jgi:hypothetical protein
VRSHKISRDHFAVVRLVYLVTISASCLLLGGCLVDVSFEVIQTPLNFACNALGCGCGCLWSCHPSEPSWGKYGGRGHPLLQLRVLPRISRYTETHPLSAGSFRWCGPIVRQKAPRSLKSKFVRPPELQGARGRPLDPLPAPCRSRSGKGPIVEKHTPSLERLRGGGG